MTPEDIQALRIERARLRHMLRDAVAVIEDFMPNLGRCALQDYGRLNDVLIDSQNYFARLKGAATPGETA